MDNAPAQRQKVAPSLLIIFAVLCIAGGFGNCSQTAVTAMLNAMSADFGVDVSTSQWLVTSYILSMGVFMPLAAFLLKRFSERFLILLALGMIAAGSLLAVLVPLFPAAMFARIIQAGGCGLIMPTMQTMIMVDLPKERMGLFMGLNGIAMGFMVNLGPTIGGVMADLFGWQSFFWLYFGIVVVLAVPGAIFSRTNNAADVAEAFDTPSFFLCAFAFIGLLLGLTNASSLGLTDLLVWLPIIVGAVLLVLFVRREKRLTNPLISMDIFADKQYTWGFIGSAVLALSFVGVSLVIPLYVQDLRGGSALDAGMVMLPASVVALLGNLVGGTAMDRFGARKVLVVSGILLVIGSVMACFCNEETPMELLTISHAIRAAGISGSIGPFIGWSLLKLPRRIVSDGSAFLTVGRQAAASLGTSAMVLIIVAVTQMGMPVLSYQAAFALSALFSVFTFAVAVFKVR